VRLATLLGGAILLGSGIVAAVPAQAALSDCPTDHTCIWAYNDHEGAYLPRVHGQSTILNLPSHMDNTMDSWANRSATYGSCGYEGANGLGVKQEWDAGRRDNNVSPLASDKISSWRTRGGC
jgi:hypothetical protein